MSIFNIAPFPKKPLTMTAIKQEQKPKGNQLEAQTGTWPVAKRPGVPERKRAWEIKLTKNQHKQKDARQYQGHWLDVQLVPMFFQTRDSQATLQGIKSAHDEHAKLRYS